MGVEERGELRGPGDADGTDRAGGPVPPRWAEDDGSPSDAGLVSRMRTGDTRAYEELYRRHSDAVRRYVRHCCRDAATANDLTDEVFARTLLAVRGGAGPDTAVRAHLLAMVRQVAASWAGTAGWELLTEDFAVFAVAAGAAGDGGPFEPDADVRAMWRAERSTVVRAFRGLPERWQAVLWHTVVEDESPREVAPLLGLTADAAAALARRAGEGLRQAHLRAHVDRSRAADGGCARHADRLGTYARGSLRVRGGRGLRRHLERCADCRSAALGAGEVCERLRALLPVAVVGWGAVVYSACPVAGPAGTYPVEAYPMGAYPMGAYSAGTSRAGTSGAAGVAAPAGDAHGGAGSGSAVFDGLGATAKAGVTAGVMAAALATALTLALVGEGQRSRGPHPGQGAQPSAASVPGGAETGTDAAARGSEPQTAAPGDSADPPAGAAGRPSGAAPAPASGTPSDAGPGTESAPGPAPEFGPSHPGTVPVPGGTPVPTSPPSAATVHRLDRLPRGGADGPTVRGGESSWLWQRSRLRIAGRDRGSGVTVAAQSSVTIDLDRSCTAFDALVGVDDLTAVRGAVRFSVYGDGVRLWRSGVVRRGDEPVPVHVPLSGRKTLRLVVEPHSVLDVAVLADWARARIGCA